MLVQYFIDRYAREANKSFKSVSKDTLDLFRSYPWPGNIRELRNVIERSIILCDTENFTVDESWLTESRGRLFGPTGAAPKLGIARSSLELKIRTLKIDKNRFKASNPL
jgi:formate hydrogenlyase transcriptional activator